MGMGIQPFMESDSVRQLLALQIFGLPTGSRGQLARRELELPVLPTLGLLFSMLILATWAIETVLDAPPAPLTYTHENTRVFVNPVDISGRHDGGRPSVPGGRASGHSDLQAYSPPVSGQNRGPRDRVRGFRGGRETSRQPPG